MLPQFGIIIHWGVYSVPAYDDVEAAKRRKIQNGSEWYMYRLRNNFRPTNADAQTKQYHTTHYNTKTYYDLAHEFDAKYWNPDDLVALFKKAGAEYVIITAKHHDGYCLWDTKHTVIPNWNSVCSGPKRNIVKELCDSVRKHNMLFGVYYSWLEWNKGPSQKYTRDIVIPQIQELLEYKPDLWWFDGDWEGKPEVWRRDEVVSIIRNATPNTLINDRLGKDNVHLADYRVFRDRYIPDIKLDIQWQHINTIGVSWGYNNQQSFADYKNIDTILSLRDEVWKKNGSFLLNVGLRSDGAMSLYERSVLDGLASSARYVQPYRVTIIDLPADVLRYMVGNDRRMILTLYRMCKRFQAVYNDWMQRYRIETPFTKHEIITHLSERMKLLLDTIPTTRYRERYTKVSFTSNGRYIGVVLLSGLDTDTLDTNALQVMIFNESRPYNVYLQSYKGIPSCLDKHLVYNNYDVDILTCVDLYLRRGCIKRDIVKRIISILKRDIRILEPTILQPIRFDTLTTYINPSIILDYLEHRIPLVAQNYKTPEHTLLHLLSALVQWMKE